MQNTRFYSAFFVKTGGANRYSDEKIQDGCF